MTTVPAAKLLTKALQQLNSGNPQSAEDLCREVLEQLGDAPDALHILGLCLHEQGRHVEAAATLERALELSPAEPGAWEHLGQIRAAAKRPETAIDAYRRALQQVKSDQDAKEEQLRLTRQLGTLLRIHGKREEALELWQRYSQIDPQNKEAWLVCGKLQSESGNHQEAWNIYQTAIEAIPDFFDALICLGNTCRSLAKPEDAIAAYQKALELQPASALCLVNIGTAHLDLGQFAESHKWYDKALEIQPDYMMARLQRCITELPMLYKHNEEIPEARSRYSRSLESLNDWIEKHPEDLSKLGKVVGFMQPFFLPYQQQNDTDLQRRYGKLICRAAAAEWGKYAISKTHRPKDDADGRLRIAFIGAGFCGHSVWKAITRGWVEQLDRKKYKLLAYYTSPKSDQQTGYARRLFETFVQGPFETAEWIQKIREADPHVIIYPEIGMDPITGLLAALNLAPIQCVTWGHPETSGYPTLDYYISADLLDSKESGAHYTEQLIRLHGTSSHYTPLVTKKSAKSRADFGIGEGEIAYLCCQNLFKYLPQYDEVLVSIAKQVPNSKFVFFRNRVAEKINAEFEQRLKKCFSKHGLSSDEKCHFHPWLELPEYDAMLGCMDVYLDSLGFSGFNTAIEALGAGLPVVTLETEYLRGRLASAILRQIGMTDGIATTVEEYVNSAVKLGLDDKYREKTRKKIKKQLPKAYEDKNAIRSLEAFIDQICSGFKNQIDPKAHLRLHERAIRLLQNNKAADAEVLLKEALGLKPDFAAAQSNLGVALMALDRKDEAIVAYRAALESEPNFADAHYNLARALMKKGHMTDALKHFEQAVELYGDRSANALNGLGNMLRTVNRPKEALPHAKKAVEVNPEFAEAWMNLGSTYRDIGQVDDAIKAYDKAIELDPDMPAPRLHKCNIMIPQGYEHQSEVEVARTRYAASLQELRDHYLKSKPEQLSLLGKVATSSQPFYLPYQCLNDKELLSRHGELVHKAVTAAFPGYEVNEKHLPGTDPEGKIRVGFVMGFFRDHSVWKAIIKGWMEKLDPEKFALYGYYTQHYKDKETDYARTLCRRFLQGPFEHATWCKQIRADDLHVLIYPEVGMDPDAASLAAMRLAPVQCATWGHPETSGLSTIDYYISGELLEPGGAQEHYSEKLILLPHTSVCYEPQPFKPSAKRRQDFGLDSDAVVFLSCQNPFKYLPKYDEIFPRIGKAVEKSVFIFFKHKKSDGLNDLFAARLKRSFAAHGLDAEKHMRILDWQSFPDFQALLSIADVFLDTIGFSGFNTANEALAAELPVVTLESEFMRGRLGAAILRQIGLEDRVAANLDEYVENAIGLGNSPQQRAAYRERVKQQLPNAYNDAAPIRALEVFLSTISNQQKAMPVWHLLTETPGSDAHAYNHVYAPRTLIDMATKPPVLALDVGCFVGATGAYIKQRWNQCRVVGIEPNKDAAAHAARKLDYVANCTIEGMDWTAAGIEKKSLDMVVLADVLEHFYNPWQALLDLKPWLAPAAEIMISLPNVRNLWLADRLWSDGAWRYEKSGLLDITHIRFFSLNEAKRMLTETGYAVSEIKVNTDHRLQDLARHKIPDNQKIDVNIGRLTLHGVTAQELLEITALQFFIRCNVSAKN